MDEQGDGRTQGKGSSVLLKCTGQLASIVSRSFGHWGEATGSGMSKSPGLGVWKDLGGPVAVIFK